MIVTDDLLGVVMPVYKGQLLSKMLPKDGFSITNVLNVAKPIGDAIERMHEAGIVHGNLTPAN